MVSDTTNPNEEPMTIINNNSKFKSLLRAFVLLFVLLSFQQFYGQYTVSGDNLVDVDDVRTYSIAGSGPSYGKTVWYANGGTVTSSTLSTATVKWTQPGNRTVGVTIWYNPVDSSPEAYPSLGVTVLSNEPPTVYSLTNNGPSSVCNNEGSVRLSDSQVGATYRLYRNSATYGSAISGTNNALTWNNLIPGTYTVRATMNSQTVTMNGSVTIGSQSADPIQITVAGNPNLNAVCQTRRLYYPRTVRAIHGRGSMVT